MMEIQRRTPLLVSFYAVFFIETVGCQPAQPVVEYSILEKLGEGNLIGNVPVDSELAEKYTAPVLQSLRYSFLEQPTGDQNAFFHIEESSGIIRTATEIDRDTLCPQMLSCHVSLDVAISPAQYFQVITVRIEIIDINDHSPAFPSAKLHRSISEGSLAGATISIPTADDPDSPEHSVQEYQILPEASPFDLRLQESLDGSVDLQLVLNRRLDREAIPSYLIEVIAYDGGEPPRQGSVLVNVTVEDANDNLPEFNRTTYEATVPEDRAEGQVIVRVHASDSDIGQFGGVAYGFTARTREHYGHLFHMNPATGEISLSGPLDYEKVKIYHLVVTAVDGGTDAQPVHATVIVNVVDTNDNRPQITINTLTTGEEAQISESSEPGTFVAHVSAIDPDAGLNGELSCAVEDYDFTLQEMYKSQFKVITNNRLDRETREEYRVSLVCTDKGVPSQRTVEELVIRVTDVNDNPPIFTSSLLSASITENNAEDAYVARVNATDADINENGEIHYHLIDAEARQLFHISRETGIIRAKVQLDHEKHSFAELRVRAADQGEPSYSATATVSIAILDENDSPPVFGQPAYSFGVFENQPRDTEVGVLYAADADSPPYDKVEYLLYADDPVYSDVFSINRETGRIYTNELLDRETRHQYYLQVKGVNRGQDNLQTSATVTIYVADENDNFPEFDFPSHTNHTVEISNLVPEGYVVARVRGHDQDIGNNAKLGFTINQGNEHGAFELDKRSGAITTSMELTHLSYHIYNLTLELRDGGNPAKATESTMHIVVDKSITYYSQYVTAGEGEEKKGLNSTIVIAVGCASGAVIVALLIAIVAIRCMDAKRRDHRYNCRTEAQKMLANSQGAGGGGHRGSFEQDSDSLTYLPVNGAHSRSREGVMDGAPNKDASFSSSGGEGSNHTWGDDSKGRGTWPTSLNQNIVQNPHGSSTVLAGQAGEAGAAAAPVAGGTGGAGSRGGPSRSCNNPRCRLSNSSNDIPHSHPYHAFRAQTTREPHEKGALWLPRRDQDSDSACSGEMSNADSGRGGSEEGENANNGHAAKRDSHTVAMDTEDGGRKMVGPTGGGKPGGLQYLPPQRKPPGGGQLSCTCCSPLSNHVCIQMGELQPARHKPPTYPATIPERAKSPAYPAIPEGGKSPIYPARPERSIPGDSRDSGYYGNRNDLHNNLNKPGPRLAGVKPGLNNFNCNNGNARRADPVLRSFGRGSDRGSTTDIADDSSSTTSGSYVVDPEDFNDAPTLRLGDQTLRETVA